MSLISDPVGDFINRIMNAGAVKHATLSVPFSLLKQSIAEKLKEVGYVESHEKKGKKIQKTLDVTLKYGTDGKHIVLGVKRISKPGRRVYKSVNEIFPVRYGKGALLLSTPKGILTDKEARKEKVGGEALFEIW